MMTVDDMMTRHPITMHVEESLLTAKTLMQNHAIRHLPIIDENNVLMGIISQRDVLRAQDSCLQRQTSQCDQELAQIGASEVMKKDIMSVNPQAGLRDAAMYMQKHKIGCLPVLSNECLVGIITDTDFVSIAINLLELLEESEPLEQE